jgi:hypothetical protein
VSLPPSSFEWQPPNARVVPPAENLEFTYLDLSPTVDLSLVVVDRETGGKLDPYALEVWYADGHVAGRKQFDAASLLFKSMVATRAFEFRVLVEGFQPYRGSDQSFRGAAGSNSLRIELERGWGARFHVMDAHWRPIGGARIVLDGACVGTTDDQGTLDVQRSARPAHALIEKPGMAYAGGDIDPATGAIDEGPFMKIDAQMRPE